MMLITEKALCTRTRLMVTLLVMMMMIMMQCRTSHGLMNLRFQGSKNIYMTTMTGITPPNRHDNDQLQSYSNQTSLSSSSSSIDDSLSTSSSSSSSSLSSSSPSSQYQRHQIMMSNHQKAAMLQQDPATYEDREKKELEWLVRSTKEILVFPNNNNQIDNTAQPTSTTTTTTTTLSQSKCRRIHMLMKAWGARRSEGAPYVVDQLFRHLQAHAASPRYITTHSYNLRLEAWAVSTTGKSNNNNTNTDAIARCLAILQELQQHPDLSPNVHSYNACIKAWIRAATPDCVDQATHLIDEMQAAYNRTGDTLMAPSRRSYNLLLYALAHSQNPAVAAKRSLDIFHSMMVRGGNNAEESYCQPNGNTFHQVMLCLARNECVPGFEDRLEETFQTCLQLATERDIEMYADTFNVYMSGWLKSKRPQSLPKILAALEIMEDSVAASLSEEDGDHGHDTVTTKPNCVTMNTVLAAYVKFSGGRDVVDHVQGMRKRLEATYAIYPDTTTFNTLVDAHSKSQRPSADVNAIAILSSMERHLIKGKKRAKPDSYTYCTVIDCLARSQRRDAGAQALEILQRMIELHQTHGGVRPTLAVYNAVLNAMAASSPVDLKSVQGLLQQMENSTSTVGNEINNVAPKPNIITYNSALKAALRCKTVEAAEWADELLKSLEENSRRGDAVKPDSFTYTTVIAVYGRSPHHNKADKAAELIERAINAYRSGFLRGELTISVFNAACNACCFVQGEETEKTHAFNTLTAISALLTNYTQPDVTTYGTLLRACSQLLVNVQAKQQAVVQQIFRKACADGLCGDFVLKQIRFAATPTTYKELLGFYFDGERIRVEDIPYDWRRNVPVIGR